MRVFPLLCSAIFWAAGQAIIAPPLVADECNPIIGCLPGQEDSSDSYWSNRTPDLKEVIAELQKKIASGDAHAKALLGTYYERGIGVEKSMAKALSLYQAAHKAGDPVGMALLAWAYEDGVDVNDDGVAELWPDKEKSDAMKVQAFPLLQAMAIGENDKKGDAEAQYILGRYYQMGSGGVAQDIEKAKEWLEKAANQGSAIGQKRLGRIFTDSNDHDRACPLYRRSAEQGYSEGENSLGWCYGTGNGLFKDYNKSREWYQKAESKGSLKGAFNLGYYYFNGGFGVKRDLKKSKTLFHKARELGNVKANYFLGLMSLCSICDQLNAAIHMSWTLTSFRKHKGALEQLKKLRSHKDVTEMDSLPLKPGTYTKGQLYSLIDDAKYGDEGAQLVVREWAAMGWVKDGDLVTLDQFPAKKTLVSGEHILLSRFMDNDKTLLTAAVLKFHKYHSQVFIAHWNVETKKLHRLVVLEPRTKLLAMSNDGNWVLVESDNVDPLTWNMGRGKERPDRLALHGTFSGKVGKILNNEDGIYSNATFSPAGRFVSAYFWPSKGKNGQKGQTVWDTMTGTPVKTFPQDATYLSFSEDDSRFFVSHRVGGRESGSTEDWLGHSVESKQDEAVFSSDNRFLVTDSKLLDARSGKPVNDCRMNVGHSGKVILTSIGSNIFLTTQGDRLLVHAIRNGSCVFVNMEEKIGGNFEYSTYPSVLSTDKTKAAVIGKDGNDRQIIQIVPFSMPKEKTLAALSIEKQKKENSKNQVAEIEQLLAADFVDEALEKLRGYITQNPQSNDFTSLVFKNRSNYGMAPAGQIILHRINALLASPKYAKIGIYWESAPGGNRISSFTLANSRPQKAGLKAGDVIASLDGYPIRLPWPEASLAYWRKVKAEQTVHIKYLRDQLENETNVTVYGSINKTTNNFLALLEEYIRFGAMAITSGHSGIGNQTIKRLKQLAQSHPYDFDTNLISYHHAVAVLHALELASKGKSKDAYTLLLKDEYAELIPFSAAARLVIAHPDIFAPLYVNPKKLAYVLGKKENDLGKTPETFFQQQAYPDINGKIIAEGKFVGTKNANNKRTTKPTIKEKAKPKNKKPTVRVLDD